MQNIMNKQERSKPFSYMHGHVLILLNRCDMTGLNYVVVAGDVEEGVVVKAITVFTAFWIRTIGSKLDDLDGIDTANWEVVRETCDHEAIVDDHMSGVTTYNLEYPDDYADSGSGSGFENVNLVDRHRLDLTDERHPYHRIARAILDEVCATGESDRDGDPGYGVARVDFIGRVYGERAYEAMVEFNDGVSKRLMLTMNESGNCLTDFTVLDA